MREIYLDSRKRNEPYGNSYVLHLQNPLKNVEKVELVAATFPNTLYNITNGSNIFSISGSNCSVANGFYSSSSLVSAVNNNLILTSSTKLTFFSEEGKFMFYDSSPFTLNVYSNEFKSITGFQNASSQTASQANGIYSQTYIGSQFIKSGVVTSFKTTIGEYVHLDITELRRPFSIDAISNVYESQSSTTFAIIPNDVQSGYIKTFKEQTDYKIQVEYPKPIDQIDRLTVNWRDASGNLLNFNGVDENSILLRFYELPLNQPSIEINEPITKVSKNPDKKTVFIMLIFSFIFILFLKNR